MFLWRFKKVVFLKSAHGTTWGAMAMAMVMAMVMAMAMVPQIVPCADFKKTTFLNRKRNMFVKKTTK